MTLTLDAAERTWSMQDARRAYAGLAAPDVADVVGEWDGRLVGRPRLRTLTLTIAALTPLRGWCGKRILVSGDVINLTRRHGAICDSTKAVAARGSSLLDGCASLVVDYSAAPPPMRWMRGEMRWLIPGVEIVGLLMVTVGRRPLGPFPFTLTRADARPPAPSHSVDPDGND